MFSFFRKKSATKDSRAEQQATHIAEDRKEEEDRKIAENSKKKIKSDSKKTLRDNKKVSFKSETESDNSLASANNVASSHNVSEIPPILTPVIVLIADDKDVTVLDATKTFVDCSSSHDEMETVPCPTQPDDSVFQQEAEPPDVFCEALEIIQPEMNCYGSLLPMTLMSDESMSHSDRGDAILSENSTRLEKDLLNLNSDDKQSVRCRRRVSFNDEETVISDPGDVKDAVIPDATHKLPSTITQRDLRQAAASSTAPFLSKESSPLLHETSSIIILYNNNCLHLQFQESHTI